MSRDEPDRVLADTSAWVEWLRRTGSPIHRRMRDLVVGDLLVVTAVVVAEVAMGARSDRVEADLRDLLASFPTVGQGGPDDLDRGATVYRLCRSAGVTPPGLVDCVVAGVALHHRAALLTADAGQARIAEVMPLRLDPASVRG